MKHIYKEGRNDRVFVLLHGTGGTENDLISIAEMLDSEAGILSVRGEVQENGMNRFFKRHGEGKYDVKDLEKRSSELLQFIKEQSKVHQFDMKKVIFFGFSNGSNIAIHMMLKDDTLFERAMLFAPLYPMEVTKQKDFSHLDVFLSLGHNDPMVPERESKHVIQLFEDRNASVETVWVEGHRLTKDALVQAKAWLNDTNE